MALEPKYEIAFRNECHKLSQMVVGSLLRLASNPRDVEELEKLVQSADTIMGNARFLEDKELESSATIVVKTFNGINDVRKKIDAYCVAIDQFGKLVMKHGTCPKGYRLENGICVLDKDYLRNPN